MYKIIKYDCFQTLKQLPDTGDLKKYEKQALIILQHSRKTFVDAEVFAEAILYIRDNWEAWDSYKGLLLRYRVYKTYKKSFKKFNRLMSKDTVRFDTVTDGEAYFYTKGTVKKAKLKISKGVAGVLESTSKELDNLHDKGFISSVEYIELKRELYSK